MKGIIYCRVSSLEQVQGTSLEHQKEACLTYARDHAIEVAAIFIEKGESATAATRTELIKALDYCKRHRNQIGVFIVWKLDRFARNTTDHYGIQAQLAKSGTRLQSVTEPIINEGPLGKMAEAMLAGYAQFENDIRKQRCEAGMQRRISEGIWPWMPPLGYVHSKTITDRRKTRPDEPDPERFLLIQRGLKEFAAGRHTITSLADALSRWGLRTRTHRPIFKQLVDRLLRDKFYAGILTNPWTGEEFTAHHQPMITLDEYFQIQGIKAAWSNGAVHPRRSAHPDFPLRQFVACVCGSGLTGSWHRGKARKHPYYNCYKPSCDRYNSYISATDLEARFIQLLCSVAPNPTWLGLFEQAVRRVWATRHQQTAVVKRRVAAERRSLDNRKQRLLEMRLADEITRDEFTRLKQELEGQIAHIQADQTTPPEPFDLDTAIQKARPFLSDLVGTWQNMSEVTQKRQLQHLVFPKGVVYDLSSDTFGTPQLAPIFELFRASDGSASHVVAGVGRYLNQIVQDVKKIVGYCEDVRELGEAA